MAYQPQIVSLERVREEFATAADKFEPGAIEALPTDDVIGILATLRSDQLAATYAQHLPLVHRFVVAELDTEAPSKRGIGRLADGDPPPRIGAKYRKRLRDSTAERDVGLAAERLVLSGFGAQAAFYEEELASEVDGDETWPAWIRHLSAYYNDTNELISRAQKEEATTYGITGAMIIGLGDHGGAELVEAYEAHGIRRGARAMTYFSLLAGAGRALHHVLSDSLDSNFGVAQPVHLLEDYEQKRNKRQLVAEI